MNSLPIIAAHRRPRRHGRPPAAAPAATRAPPARTARPRAGGAVSPSRKRSENATRSTGGAPTGSPSSVTA